jgi:hypothetical protein
MEEQVKTSGLSKTILLGAVMLIPLLSLPADEPPLILPVASYQALVTEGQTVHTPGGGVIVQGERNLFVGIYTNSTFTRAPSVYRGGGYHTVDLLYDGGINRHRYLALAKSASDRPVAGGWNTFQAAGVYGYEVVSRPNTSVVLGGGLAVGDFGLKTPDGDTWPLLPVPFARVLHTSPWLNFSFDFITGPNVNVTVAPDRDIRLVVDARIDQFRDIRDVIFDTSLHYRVLSVGVRNDTFGFDLAGESEPLESFHYALYGTLDLVLLSVTGGYAFDSLLRYDDGAARKTGDGFVLAIQGMIPLGGGEQ